MLCIPIPLSGGIVIEGKWLEQVTVTKSFQRTARGTLFSSNGWAIQEIYPPWSHIHTIVKILLVSCVFGIGLAPRSGELHSLHTVLAVFIIFRVSFCSSLHLGKIPDILTKSLEMEASPPLPCLYEARIIFLSSTSSTVSMSKLVVCRISCTSSESSRWIACRNRSFILLAASDRLVGSPMSLAPSR